MPREPEGPTAAHVTRDVEPSTLRDLVVDPPRASVAFVERDAVQLLPVWARQEDGRHHFGARAEAAPELEGREVVLILDDGAYWFELRGISVRGVARRVDSCQLGGPGVLVWYAIEPRRVLAWNYDAIRSE